MASGALQPHEVGISGLVVDSDRAAWPHPQPGMAATLPSLGEGAGSKPGTEKRHGCPSRGIGLTPDETELWLTDAANSQVRIFDATALLPKEVANIPLRDQPGWVTFGLDGRSAYPSTGDVIEVKNRKIFAELLQPSLRDSSHHTRGSRC